MSQIKIGIGSCLMGNPVRYNGEHKRANQYIQNLKGFVELVPFCPEVGIGMGVPRPPIQLVKQGDRIYALGVEDATVDVTLALQAYTQQVSDQLAGASGYIFKSRSPSCGLTDTDLFEPNGTLIGKATGVFAAQIQVLFPDMPLIDELTLAEPSLRNAFVQDVRDYQSAQQDCQ